MPVQPTITKETVRHIQDAARAYQDANYALTQAIEGLPAAVRIELLTEQRRIKHTLRQIFDARLLPIVMRDLKRSQAPQRQTKVN